MSPEPCIESEPQRPIRVIYDDQIFTSQRYGGISRYFAELAANLNHDPRIKAQILVPFCVNQYGARLPTSCRLGVPLPDIRGIGRVTGYLNRRSSSTIINLLSPDIVHQTYYPFSKPKLKKGIRVVTTIHDMIHELFPEAFPRHDRTAELKRRAVQIADQVICVSENTKQDLMRILDVPEQKIAVVHHGSDHFDFVPRKSPWPNRKPYILYVGLRRAYKNFAMLLKAYAGSQRLKSDFDLLCFGGGRLERDELDQISRCGVSPEAVRWVKGDDDLLQACYQHASAFVYPSLYEGFGIPPLEAMTQRCPVVSSDVSSIPEVLGDAAEYFDPNEAEDISGAIEKVVYEAGKRNRLIEMGIERAGRFTWRRCAAETFEAYSKLLVEAQS